MRIECRLRKPLTIFVLIVGFALGNLQVLFAQTVPSKRAAIFEGAVEQSLLSLIADLDRNIDRQPANNQGASDVDQLKALGKPLSVSLSRRRPAEGGLIAFDAIVRHQKGVSSWSLTARPDTAQIATSAFMTGVLAPPSKTAEKRRAKKRGPHEGGGPVTGSEVTPGVGPAIQPQPLPPRPKTSIDVRKASEKAAQDSGKTIEKTIADSNRMTKATAPISDAIKALQPILFATNRKIDNGPELQVASITATRSPEVRYGLAIVSVPKLHVIGNVERPNSKFLGLWTDKETDEHDFRIKKLTSFSRNQFIDALREDNDSILLFVHGYNVSFADAVFKAAQIAYDANYGGSVVVFSWPSAGTLLKYDYDRESASFSVGDLFSLLTIMTQEVQKKKIYVVAHSLGNQIVVDALQQAALSKVSLNISELVMAAPDVDKDVFTSKAAQIKSVAGKITMYASSNDKALLASDKKAWGMRMGYIGDTGPNLVDGIETIDVSAVGDDMFGLNHGTFSGNRSVLDDLGRLIISGVHPPGLRSPTLRFMPDKVNTRYWMYPE